MTKKLIITALLSVGLLTSSAAFAAVSDGAGHGPKFNNILPSEQLRRDRQFWND